MSVSRCDGIAESGQDDTQVNLSIAADTAMTFSSFPRAPTTCMATGSPRSLDPTGMTHAGCWLRLIGNVKPAHSIQLVSSESGGTSHPTSKGNVEVAGEMMKSNFSSCSSIHDPNFILSN